MGGIVKYLGPGLIIAATIVGSGELIATTAVGAEAGFLLLWLIIIGCVIKVFAQVEFGRYSIINGKGTLKGLDEVPGPRWHVNWIIWYWLIMFVASLAQLGGIVGGVGQALTIHRPITESGKIANHYQDLQVRQKVTAGLLGRYDPDDPTAIPHEEERVAELRAQSQVIETELAALSEKDLNVVSHDDLIWATLITAVTIVLLVLGRYGIVQAVSTILVAGFTFLTIGNLVHLQTLPEWRVTWADLLSGLSFQVPSASNGRESGLATALMAFGIIGVGATELIQYPYWCLEKGYARWTGENDGSPEWAARARGWLRVLQWDAWCSMIVYTFATVAFYLLGAAVLGRVGLNPEGQQMVRTLAEMYVPVFGSFAQSIFLLGAFAVLYSTFFVANASHARVCADAVYVFGLSSGSEEARRYWVRVFCVVFPLICLATYAFIRAPKQLVLVSGLMQAIMLPMLGAGALYFRYRRSDKLLTPSIAWDVMLWLSFVGLLIAGGWAFFDTFSKVVSS
ncbi:Nramp family divalent metal transporter [Kolteria novifilia]